MKYKNKRTGKVLELTSIVNDKDWVLLNPSTSSKPTKPKKATKKGVKSDE